MLRNMNVYDISLLHDHKAPGTQAFSLSKAELRTPIPIVDMIFSQPLRRLYLMMGDTEPSRAFTLSPHSQLACPTR